MFATELEQEADQLRLVIQTTAQTCPNVDARATPSCTDCKHHHRCCLLHHCVTPSALKIPLKICVYKELHLHPNYTVNYGCASHSNQFLRFTNRCRCVRTIWRLCWDYVNFSLCAEQEIDRGRGMYLKTFYNLKNIYIYWSSNFWAVFESTIKSSIPILPVIGGFVSIFRSIQSLSTCSKKSYSACVYNQATGHHPDKCHESLWRRDTMRLFYQQTETLQSSWPFFF